MFKLLFGWDYLKSIEIIVVDVKNISANSLFCAVFAVFAVFAEYVNDVDVSCQNKCLIGEVLTLMVYKK